MKAAEDGRYGELHFRDGVRTAVREAYGYQMEYLRRVVPDEPFPRANDGRVVEEYFKEKLVEGLVV